jgi:hypothetical protein
VEQPCILDCDNRLVGESLEQGNLPLREKLNLGAAELNRADRDAFSHQGDTEDRPNTFPPRVFAALWKLLRLCLQVGDMDGAFVQHRSAIDRAANKWEGEFAGEPVVRDRAVVGDEAELVAVYAEDRCVDCLTQAGGALRYGIDRSVLVR